MKIALFDRFTLRQAPALSVRNVAYALVAMCLWFSTQAGAQPTPENPTFAIKGFVLDGDNPLSESVTRILLAPYVRPDATIETLQKATASLETEMKARGYALHRVALPAQELGAQVKLTVVKFVIGKITIDGREQFSEANIRASVPVLQEGESPNFRTMSVQTTLANESPAKRIQVVLKESEEPDQIDARIVVKESRPWNISMSESNYGSTATGIDRFTVAASHSNLFDRDHQLTLAYTTSLEQPKAVAQVGVNYRIPLYLLGGVVGVNYTQSDVVGEFGAFKSNGAGRTAGLNYSHYLHPSGGYRGFVTLGLDYKQFDVTHINDVPLVGQTVRGSTPLTLGYNARVEGDYVVWGYNVDVAVNTPFGNGNDLTSYRSEDTRIETARWVAVHAGANFATGVGTGWIWSTRGQLQYSPQALISGEQFGLGGSNSVRGTGERPLSGDSGAVFSTELSTPEWLPGLRLLGFVDAGWLANTNPNGNPKPPNDSLSSVGLGLRFSLTNLLLTVDFGRVVSGSRMPAAPNSGVPQAGDQKLHLNLSARF